MKCECEMGWTCFPCRAFGKGYMGSAAASEGSDEDIRDLLERSSLGTPEAKAARESTQLERAQEIVRRVNARPRQTPTTPTPPTTAPREDLR